MIRVLLAEDHQLVRKGIRALLEAESDIEIVAEAENGMDAVKLSEKHKPDVIMMDINMPKLNGIQATQQLKKVCPNSSVVMLSMFSEESYILQSIKAGAKGYLLKNSLVEELPLAIKAIHQGDSYFSPSVSSVLLKISLDGGKNIAGEDPLKQLTNRELQVMQQIAEGQTTKLIAKSMNVSEKTIETHRNNLMTKLDLHDIAGVVRWAIKNGLIFLD